MCDNISWFRCFLVKVSYSYFMTLYSVCRPGKQVGEHQLSLQQAQPQQVGLSSYVCLSFSHCLSVCLSLSVSLLLSVSLTLSAFICLSLSFLLFRLFLEDRIRVNSTWTANLPWSIPMIYQTESWSDFFLEGGIWIRIQLHPDPQPCS